MIRSLAILILVLSAAIAGIPNSTPTHITSSHPPSNNPSLTLGDPNRTLTAFNYTYGQADLYTKSSPTLKITPAPNSTNSPYNFTKFIWLSTEPRTTNASMIAGSGFRFNLTKTNVPLTNATRFQQVVSWNLTIPKFNCGNCYSTSINFTFFGGLTKGTSANYTIAKTSTGKIVKSENFTGTGSAPVSFPTTKIIGCLGRCFNATLYMGSNLTITFRFGWNSSETGMSVDVGELIVGSQDHTFKNSVSNYMTLNSAVINHFARFSGISFNSTVNLPAPSHVWSNEVLNIYYPAGYNVTQIILQNSTFQTVYRVPGRSAFETQNCLDLGACTISLVALNMSDLAPFRSLYLKNANVTILATTPNTASQLNTLGLSVPTSYFVPSDSLTVQVVNKPAAANLTSIANPILNITFTDPTGSQTTIAPKQNLQTATGGNFSSTIPTGPFGVWTVTAAFISNYDMGSASRTFTVAEILMSPNALSYSGSNSALTAQGTMIYATSNPTPPPASNVNGVVFAVDTGTPTTNPVTTTTTNPPSTSLYIANVTLVNGVFGQTQPLVMTFTIINPTSSLFSANVTIEHEWYGSQTHGVNVTIPLTLGDQPFSTQVSRRYPYEADISFASSPLQMKLTSLTTLNPKTVSMSRGSDPLVLIRQNSGLFKITVKSSALSSSTVSSSSLESAPYAYVPGLPSFAGRYLAYAAFITRSDGSFSPTISSNAILAAKRLVLFALARDGNGVTLVNGQNPGTTDSTILQASLDAISQLTVGQTVHPTLHLTGNASKVTEIITITESLQGSGVVDTQRVTIQPGTPQTVAFTLTAPQAAGSYAVTFSSPDYGGPFATQTVQVSLVSSNLQLLIPAAIGLAAAIIVLGFYLVRRTPEKDVEEGKPRPAGPKPKTQPGMVSSTSKSLTQTRDN